MEKEKGRVEWRRPALGVSAALGAYLATLLLAAYLTVSGRIGEEQMERAVWLCALLAAFAGGVVATQGKRDGMSLTLGAVGFWTAAVLIGFLAAGGIAPADAVKLLAACVLGGALTLGTTRSGKGRRGKRHKTPRSRRAT